MAKRVVVVTGAGKGLGRAYALRLAAEGAAVVVNNRWTDRAQPSSAEAVVAEIRAAGGSAVANLLSVEDEASGEALIAQALAAFGRLDAVVANAGVSEAVRVRRQTPQDFARIFAVNFFGTYHLARSAFLHMTGAGGGRIVVSTSSAGLHGGDGMAAYASSKAAVIGLMRALAVEGRASGVLVNAIAPYALTAMTERFVGEDLAPRMDPAAVAPLVAWLAGPDCDVSGQTLVAGGGAVRAAFAVEGPRVDMDGDVGATVHAALAAQPRRPFADSHVAFTDFMAESVEQGA
jgi:NAD(P)-dependent dehydrogenase (short-subunit alcohol dehydrogenase family)